jgi:hypothetical protein
MLNDRLNLSCTRNVVGRCLLAFLVLASPVFAQAQFHKPKNEELKMTDDPKAPGAAAVYLNLEETTDDYLNAHTYYARIKVLKEEGLSLATFTMPMHSNYFKIVVFEARTIHPDGAIIPLKVKAEDLKITKDSNGKIENKVFTLPSAGVGSILEYYYQILSEPNIVDATIWEIQQKYFVHKAHYAFTQSGGNSDGEKTFSPNQVDVHHRQFVSLVWWPFLPPGARPMNRVDVDGRFIMDLTDIPPIPDEEWMAPIQSFRYRMVFNYVSSRKEYEFWEIEGNRWSKEVDRFTDPGKSAIGIPGELRITQATPEDEKVIHDAVSGVISPGDSDLEKARKLYKAAQALDNTDFSHAKEAEPQQSELLKLFGVKKEKNAADVWKQKSGNSHEIALLYLSMLRAAKLTAYDALVTNRDQTVFFPSLLYFDQLDDDIVILNLDGKKIYLDPGEKMCPFQTLHWKHSGAGGIEQTPDRHHLFTTPPQENQKTTIARSGDVNMNEHGAITASFRFVMTGQEALRWRQAALENDLDLVKKQFDSEVAAMVPEGVEAHVDHFQALDDPEAELVAEVTAHGSLGSSTANQLTLPGFFFESRGREPFVNQEKRQTPVDMHYSERVTDQVVYHLPLGLVVAGAPQEDTISWGNYADFAVKSKIESSQVTVSRQFTRDITDFEPALYQVLRGFYKKVAAADQQQLVLIKSATQKGN